MLIAIIIVFIPQISLIKIIYLSQVLNGLLLPIVLISMMLLVNNKKIMGDYINTPIKNIIGWAAVLILIVLTLLLFIFSFI